MSKLGRGLLGLACLLWLLSSACSLVVDPAELKRGCAAGTKACEVTPGDLRCVSSADPEYGCARESCVPCTLANAVEVCGGDGECVVGTCLPEFQNCNLTERDGCEVDLDNSYANCGHCGLSCSDDLRTMPHTNTAECKGGRCVVDQCDDGYADCDEAASNGCEKALAPELCGRCAGCPGRTSCNLETRRCE